MSRHHRIEQKLYKSFSPAPNFMQVLNESHQHHVPKDSETHFKVILVTEHFQNLNRIARHRLVNQLLADEFAQGLHALSLSLYTPEEWERRGEQFTKSPICRGGFAQG